jgi:hypothetical protein
LVSAALVCVHASRQDIFYGPEVDSFGWFAQTAEFAFLLAAIQGYPELAVLIGRLREAEQEPTGEGAVS